jgi:Ca2+-binding EF-hand superfamily protein
MRRVLLMIGAVALICLAGFVAAHAAPQDQTSTESSTATASEPDQGTKLRLARMDTSPAAFRKLDADNDGRISPLEAADNPRVAAAFTIADRDKDGYLSKEEFASMGSAANRNVRPQ